MVEQGTYYVGVYGMKDLELNGSVYLSGTLFLTVLRTISLPIQDTSFVAINVQLPSNVILSSRYLWSRELGPVNKLRHKNPRGGYPIVIR